MKLFISPHNDDETLFGAFTILRERPLVLVVTDSERQKAKGITAEERRLESQAALRILEAPVAFLGIPDQALETSLLEHLYAEFVADFGPFTHVFMPAEEEGGNVDHNLIARRIGGLIPESGRTNYLTYTAAGKSTSTKRVNFAAEWPLRKLKALACYRSQIVEPSTRDHFLREQYEYYAA